MAVLSAEGNDMEMIWTWEEKSDDYDDCKRVFGRSSLVTVLSH